MRGLQAAKSVRIHGCFVYCRAAVLVAGTESGNVHIVQVDVEARRLRIESVERLPQRQGFACASLIYCIRYNAKLQQFALCTERGVVMSFSL